VCGAYGPIVIVDPKVEKQADLCLTCSDKVREMEKRLEREDLERRLHADIQKLNQELKTHSDARNVRPELLADNI
jgi:hypothetical protein